MTSGNEVVEKMAAAIWETWRTSGAAKEEYRDLPWTELCAMAGRHPDGNVAQRLMRLGIDEAKAALAVLSENVSDEMAGRLYGKLGALVDGCGFTSDEMAARGREGISAALLVLKDQPR